MRQLESPSHLLGAHPYSCIHPSNRSDVSVPKPLSLQQAGRFPSSLPLLRAELVGGEQEMDGSGPTTEAVGDSEPHIMNVYICIYLKK
jgi:hypothetical protein